MPASCPTFRAPATEQILQFTGAPWLKIESDERRSVLVDIKDVEAALDIFYKTEAWQPFALMISRLSEAQGPTMLEAYYGYDEWIRPDDIEEAANGLIAQALDRENTEFDTKVNYNCFVRLMSGCGRRKDLFKCILPNHVEHVAKQLPSLGDTGAELLADLASQASKRKRLLAMIKPDQIRVAADRLFAMCQDAADSQKNATGILGYAELLGAAVKKKDLLHAFDPGQIREYVQMVVDRPGSSEIVWQLDKMKNNLYPALLDAASVKAISSKMDEMIKMNKIYLAKGDKRGRLGPINHIRLALAP